MPLADAMSYDRGRGEATAGDRIRYGTTPIRAMWHKLRYLPHIGETIDEAPGAIASAAPTVVRGLQPEAMPFTSQSKLWNKLEKRLSVSRDTTFATPADANALFNKGLEIIENKFLCASVNGVNATTGAKTYGKASGFAAECELLFSDKPTTGDADTFKGHKDALEHFKRAKNIFVDELRRFQLEGQYFSFGMKREMLQQILQDFMREYEFMKQAIQQEHELALAAAAAAGDASAVAALKAEQGRELEKLEELHQEYLRKPVAAFTANYMSAHAPKTALLDGNRCLMFDGFAMHDVYSVRHTHSWTEEEDTVFMSAVERSKHAIHEVMLDDADIIPEIHSWFMFGAKTDALRGVATRRGIDLYGGVKLQILKTDDGGVRLTDPVIWMFLTPQGQRKVAAAYVTTMVESGLLERLPDGEGVRINTAQPIERIMVIAEAMVLADIPIHDDVIDALDRAEKGNGKYHSWRRRDVVVNIPKLKNQHKSLKEKLKNAKDNVAKYRKPYMDAYARSRAQMASGQADEELRNNRGHIAIATGDATADKLQKLKAKTALAKKMKSYMELIRDGMSLECPAERLADIVPGTRETYLDAIGRKVGAIKAGAGEEGLDNRQAILAEAKAVTPKPPELEALIKELEAEEEITEAKLDELVGELNELSRDADKKREKVKQRAQAVIDRSKLLKELKEMRTEGADAAAVLEILELMERGEPIPADKRELFYELARGTFEERMTIIEAQLADLEAMLKSDQDVTAIADVDALIAARNELIIEIGIMAEYSLAIQNDTYLDPGTGETISVGIEAFNIEGASENGHADKFELLVGRVYDALGRLDNPCGPDMPGGAHKQSVYSGAGALFGADVTGLLPLMQVNSPDNRCSNPAEFFDALEQLSNEFRNLGGNADKFPDHTARLNDRADARATALPGRDVAARTMIEQPTPGVGRWYSGWRK